MIYIHIPFCKKRCIYCDFYSTTYGSDVRAAYVRALCRELALRRGEWGEAPVKTLYFGGGTPSQLSYAEVHTIMQAVRKNYILSEDAEITFEANPDDMSADYAAALAREGINRLSFGVQSFSDHTLRFLRRRHTAQQASEAVSTACRAGITNVSIDLMFGLPGQSPADWDESLRQAFSLPIKHISAYALTIEPPTALGQMMERGELEETDEEVYNYEFDTLMQAAADHGFNHYEISNFALPGYHSRHNSAYWEHVPYIGIGAGAHSFDGQSRRFNHNNLASYLQTDGLVPHTVETLTLEERFNECVFTALRTSNGLHLEMLADEFPLEWIEDLQYAARPHIERGNLTSSPLHVLRLTREGIKLSDGVMSDLMRV